MSSMHVLLSIEIKILDHKKGCDNFNKFGGFHTHQRMYVGKIQNIQINQNTR